MKGHETRALNVASFALALLWIGLLVGVSFLATPAKFLASSLTLPVALDVGRHTFAIFNKAEWLLAAALLIVVLLRPPHAIAAIGSIVTALIVLLETAWLLPVLDRRVGLSSPVSIRPLRACTVSSSRSRSQSS
jgi:hypothetical protein